MPPLATHPEIERSPASEAPEAMQPAGGRAGDGRRGERQVEVRVPDRARPNGPVTRARLRRTFRAIGAGWAAGALLTILNLSSAAIAFGLGLLLPGGGFAYTGDPLLVALSVMAFSLALVIYWAFGPVLLPPLVWIGAAALSAQAAGAQAADGSNWEDARAAVPAALLLLIATGFAVQRIRFVRARARGRRLSERVSGIRAKISDPPATPAVSESGPEDLAALRYALDLTLQPIDEWEGFSFLDQFREAAVRYQLNFAQYAMAMSQYTRTPAFTGYLAEAQRNSIEKMLDPRVWKYWRWENLWGNLRWEPDPCRRDNVMLSGYWGVNVGLYQTLCDDRRYEKPGSLTFRNGPGEVYPYDFHSLAELLRGHLSNSPFCMFPCEPSWIYPFCSSYALNTVILHARENGLDASDLIAGYRESFDRDFMRADGSVVAIRNGRLGFSIAAAPTINESVLVPWLNPAMPELAQRLWWTMRERAIDLDGDEVLPTIRDLDRVDVGNYRFGADTFARTMVVLAAREMGDDEAADAVQRSLDAKAVIERRDGVRRYAKLSVYGNLAHTLSRFTRRDAMRDMIAFDRPVAWSTGPRLAGAVYPDVLVAKAVTDGCALDLVLRPGDGPVRTSLSLDRLAPGAEYVVEGDATGRIVADGRGEGVVSGVDLGDRAELRIRPA